MDGGANICVTGDLDSMIGVVNIPPMPFSVAIEGATPSEDDCCTKRGYTPLQCSDGSIYWQVCFYCANIVETIISPQAVLASSDVFFSWTQTGFRDGRPGSIRFDSADGLLSMAIDLEYIGGLYYCHSDIYTVDPTPVPYDRSPIYPSVHRVSKPILPPTLRRPSRYQPVSKRKQLESELWLLRLGSPGVSQLDTLPSNTTGLPAEFDYHPFRFIDFKAQAQIRKQAAQRSAVRTSECKRRYYMDFGFMRASADDFKKGSRLKSDDRVVFSYDGYSSYLLVVDEASRYVWVFLTSSKDPPIDLVTTFLQLHGHPDGGCVRTDQGGELARSEAFRTMLLKVHRYTLEPTGSDSPSQNGAVEIYNDKFGIRTRTLLYGSGLPAKYWSAALCHSVYLHNRLVHSETKKTPFEGYFGMRPDLSRLRVFGSRVCVKRAGKRAAKLDHNDFTGIFLGYTATDHNVQYIDLTSGIVKTSHHADFDEAWYLQPNRPPAAQLLYDLGLEYEEEPHSDEPELSVTPETTSPITPTHHPPPLQKQVPLYLVTTHVPWPPFPIMKASTTTSWMPPPKCLITPIPLRETAIPTPHPLHRPRTAAAARLSGPPIAPNTTYPSEPHLGPRIYPSSGPCDFHCIAARTKASIASELVSEFLITQKDIAPIYMSPNPYFEAFEEEIDLRKFDLAKHKTAGLCLAHHDGRLFLMGMAPSTPGAKLPRWRSRIKGAWLIKVGSMNVSTILEAQQAFQHMVDSGGTQGTLLFSHPELRPNLTHDGLPIVSSAPFHQQTHDQLNKRWEFDTVAEYLRKAPPYSIVDDGDVLNIITKVMKLTRGKLVHQDDWNCWNPPERLLT